MDIQNSYILTTRSYFFYLCLSWSAKLSIFTSRSLMKLRWLFRYRKLSKFSTKCGIIKWLIFKFSNALLLTWLISNLISSTFLFNVSGSFVNNYSKCKVLSVQSLLYSDWLSIEFRNYGHSIVLSKLIKWVIPGYVLLCITIFKYFCCYFYGKCSTYSNGLKAFRVRGYWFWGDSTGLSTSTIFYPYSW